MRVWISRCKRSDKFNPDNARVCSVHFRTEDYERDLKNELFGLPPRKMCANAVPCLSIPNWHGDSFSGSSADTSSSTSKINQKAPRKSLFLVVHLLKLNVLHLLSDEPQNVNNDDILQFITTELCIDIVEGPPTAIESEETTLLEDEYSTTILENEDVNQDAVKYLAGYIAFKCRTVDSTLGITDETCELPQEYTYGGHSKLRITRSTYTFVIAMGTVLSFPNKRYLTGYGTTAIISFLTLAAVAYVRRREKITAIENRVIFITGCDSGLGYSFALHAHKLGFIVIAGCLNVHGEGAQQLQNLCLERLHIIQLDVTNTTSIESAVQSVETILKENPKFRKYKYRYINGQRIFKSS
ncbi:hypothetical protein ANN_09496 [Periplaneta americana]|uniref:THAP-type domain-containing protein n=1 Tax=Periplaneta americana TaxID=6978 RepID=A0ABQ8TLG4_PERAM|nr:hypothetical protein ANN_09496 [Periplaneta americana]